MSEKVIAYIQARIKELEAQKEKARLQAQELGNGPRPLAMGLKPHPAAEQFMLDLRIGTLRSLVADLEAGKHL